MVNNQVIKKACLLGVINVVCNATKNLLKGMRFMITTQNACMFVIIFSMRKSVHNDCFARIQFLSQWCV